MAARLKAHQEAWLLGHPERTAEWLRNRLKDGFDVHHVDGDHSNNKPDNLVLIEMADHMRLHERMLDIRKAIRNRWVNQGAGSKASDLKSAHEIYDALQSGSTVEAVIGRFWIRGPNYPAKARRVATLSFEYARIKGLPWKQEWKAPGLRPDNSSVRTTLRKLYAAPAATTTSTD